MNQRRALFAGINETNKPGSIQVLRYHPFAKVFEIQAHSLPVERLKISYDNQFLFSAGLDGVLCIFQVVDKMVRKKEKELPVIQYSEELLFQKANRDKIQQEIERCKSDIKEAETEKFYQMEERRQKNEKRIQELT